MGPGERAVLAAKSGTRFRLDPTHVTPGCIAWMPWAGVIKVTHRDFNNAKDGDGVVVLTGDDKKKKRKEATTTATAEAGGKAEQRPGQRAWNHPVIVLRTHGEKVWVVAVTSYKGRNLKEKFDKYPEKARRRLLAEVLPILPADDHPFARGAGPGGNEYRGLKLGGEGRMFKSGYVKLGDVYEMDWRDLQRFGRESLRRYWLDEESVARLLRVFGKVNPWFTRLAYGEKIQVIGDPACQPLPVKSTSAKPSAVRRLENTAKSERQATKGLRAAGVAKKAAKKEAQAAVTATSTLKAAKAPKATNKTLETTKKSHKATKVVKGAKNSVKHARLGKL